MKELVPAQNIESKIFQIRGKKVVLDTDLAQLYGVSVKRLNEQVKRNRKRFPSDFMFLLTRQEVTNLRSQFATLKRGHGQHRKYLPYAFTEHGAIMAASVLNSQRAIEVSVFVVRAFVKLREMVSAHRELARKLAELEREVKGHGAQIRSLVDAILRLMAPPGPEPEPKRSRIGFR